ncbi:MAG TPA: hypothetical protein PLQ35_01655 [bacterium]|nr:hypothetical protein [bacterium]
MRKEIVTCLLVRYDGHNYWVYRYWNLLKGELAFVDDKHSLPHAIRFT